MAKLMLTLEGGPETDAETLQQLNQSLRRDLLETDVEAVESAEAKLPAGAKSGLAIDWNTLIITLVSSGTLSALIVAIQAWMLRNKECSVTLTFGEDSLTIDGPGPYSDEQQEAIDRWLARHRGYVLP
jgi:hypothetical protein